jgi:putative nucleotidyltransferase with HDIG domain
MRVDQLITEILADLKANRLKLPTLPQVALKINDIIDSPNATIKDVAKVLGADAALSARVLQIANSPLVRGPAPVENVQAAITRMGMGMVRNIVTSFLVNALFHSKHDALKRRIMLLWAHSVRVAAISHVLANQFTQLKPDAAMLAGLIHDIGKLPLIAKAEGSPDLANNPEILDKLDEKLHTTLGKVIVQSWGFSQDLISAVSEHENMKRDSDTVDITDVVTIANLLSYVGKEHRYTQLDWATIPAFDKLGLSPEDSIATLEEAQEEIAEIMKLLAS